MDNAGNNGTMIEWLQKLIDGFPGEANRTRCFAHILNLVAKTILAQFDTKKKKGANVVVDEDDLLTELATELEEEEARCVASNKPEELEDGDEEEWIDERENMTLDDRDEHEKFVRPVKLVLTKVDNQ